ncbi:S-adenosyl-l-methionine hydroxide adenosyltransferase family protein [Bacteroidota bacterium]
MSIVTLTTDWNTDDYYTGSLKGKILSQCSQIQIIDISHQVPAFNISHAAFILRNSYHNFPPGSIHIIGVNTEGGEDIPFLLVEYKKHYFIGADNGIFGLMFSEDPDRIIALNSPNEIQSFTSFNVFADTACKLASGEKPESLGKPAKEYKERIPIRAAIDKNVLSGSVIYIDSFRNAITNISRELFDRVGEGREFEIFVQSNHYVIKKINQYYNETAAGEILALFNSVGLLEIAMNSGNAADLLGLSTSSSIRVKFAENKEDRPKAKSKSRK